MNRDRHDFMLLVHTAPKTIISYGEHMTKVFTVLFIWCSLSTMLLTACDLPMLNRQQTATNACFCTDHVCVTESVFSPDNKFILTGSTDGRIHWWDIDTGDLVQTMEVSSQSTNSVINSIDFSDDGRLMISTDRGGTTKIWNVQTKAVLQILVNPSPSASITWTAPHGVLSPDGAYALTNAADAYLWDVSTGTILRTFTGHHDGVMAVAFSPDGRYVATGGADTTVRLWDTTTGKLLRVFTGHTSQVRGTLFSPDGRHLLTHAADGTARLWNVETGDEVQVLKHGLAIWTAAFSADGKRIFTGGVDDLVYVWDRQSGKRLQQLNPHRCDVTSIALSSDGKYVVTSSQMPFALVWNVQTGMPIRQLAP